MKKVLTLSALVLFSSSALAVDIMEHGYRAYGSPVNYNYVGVSLGGGKLNRDGGANSEVSVTKFSAQMLATENILVNLEYEGRFTNHNNNNERADNYSALIGYRQNVSENSDVVLGVKLGGSAVQRKHDQTEIIEFEDHNLLTGINLSYFYGLSDQLDSRAVLEYNDSKRNSETSFELGLDYYLNKHFSVGGYGKLIYMEGANLNHLGIMSKLRF